MLSTCAVFVWQSRHRGVAQFGRAPRSGRGGRGFKSRHLDHQRDAGSKVALDSALFYCLHTDEWFVVVQGFLCVTPDPNPHWVQRRFLFAQLCVAQLCSALRTKALQWFKVLQRDAGLNFALGSASLFVCTVMRCATVQCAQDALFDMAQSSHA